MPFRPQAPLNIGAEPWLGRSPNSKEPLAARRAAASHQAAKPLQTLERKPEVD